MSRKHSEQLFNDARHYIPGGVNSPVRAFNGVGGTPVFFHRAEGAYVYDEDDNRYIDYIGSWGPMILGHCDADVREKVHAAIDGGMSFGAPTAIEVAMAKKVCELVPSMEQVRMVSSGTEATMSAIRLARGFTGRDLIVKFEGCYHGHVDSLLVKAGSGALTLGVPSSPGIPKAVTEDTLTLTYNDIASVEACFAEHGERIACVIVEPVAGNMNCVPPVKGFLEGLRKCCDDYNSVLIFDEVMTGFRIALGGAQAHYNVKPDMTTHQVGGMFGFYFTDQTLITRFEQVMACDQERFKRFFHGMLDRGVYLAPSAFEAGFISIAHSDADIDFTLEQARAALALG